MLVAERPHRAATIRAGRQHLTSTVGYLLSAEADVTAAMHAAHAASTTLSLEIEVDSTRRATVDGNIGSIDLGAVGLHTTAFPDWGGIGGHVYLDCREAAWLQHPRITTTLQEGLGSAEIRAAVEIGGALRPGLELRLSILAPGGAAASGGVRRNVSAAAQRQPASLPAVRLANPALWAPETPVRQRSFVISSNGEFCRGFVA